MDPKPLSVRRHCGLNPTPVRAGASPDGPIAEGHAEDLTQDLSGFASREGKRDVEGQDQPQQIRRAMNAGEVDGGGLRSRGGELGGPEVIFPILVAELELGEAQLLQKLLIPVQGLLLLGDSGGSGHRAVGTLFPSVEGALAVRTPVRSLAGTMTKSDLRQASTDFAAAVGWLGAHH